MVRATQPSVLRMVTIAQRIARAGRGRLAVFRLLNTTRGWDNHHPPVMDVEWALRQVRERYGERPVALVGHSSGAGRPSSPVSSRRCAPSSPSTPGSTRTTTPTCTAVVRSSSTGSPTASRRRSARPWSAVVGLVGRRLASRAQVGFIAIPGGRHAMLRHGSLFESYASDFVQATMLGAEPTTPAVAATLEGDFLVEG